MKFEREARYPGHKFVEFGPLHEEGVVEMAVLNSNPLIPRPDVQKWRHFKSAPVIQKVFEYDVVISTT